MINQDALQEKLKRHQDFLNDIPGGERLNLKGAYLEGADLRGAYLEGAYLEGAYLKEAYLREAYLKGAYLRRANLEGADLKEADLKEADLTWAYLRGAYLEGADLKGADLKGANLKGANLKGAKGLHQGDAALLLRVAEAALSSADALDMATWHSCETTHCIAGWAVTLAENGKELEKEFSTAEAGRQLLGDIAATHFYDSAADAKKWLRSVLEEPVNDE